MNQPGVYDVLAVFKPEILSTISWRLSVYDVVTGRKYGEDRWIAIGMTRGRVVVLAYTEGEDGETIRIISRRKALSHERKRYEETLIDARCPIPDYGCRRADAIVEQAHLRRQTRCRRTETGT